MARTGREGRAGRGGRGSGTTQPFDISTTAGLADLARQRGLEEEAERAKKAPLGIIQRLGRLWTAFETGNAVYQRRYDNKSFLGTYLEDIGTGIKSAITGREERLTPKKYYKDILVKEGSKDRPGKMDYVDLAGFSGDVLGDPTTYLGGFVGKLFLRGTKGLIKLAKALPVVGKPVKGALESAGELFVPFAKVKRLGKKGEEYADAFNKYAKGTRAETDLFLDELGKQATKVKVIPTAGLDIGEAVERGQRTGNKLVDEVMEAIVGTQKKMTEQELKRGILQTELPDYMHHMLTPQAADHLKSGGNLFITPLGRAAKLGAAKERELIRIVSEAGKDVSFTKEHLALKGIKKTKVIEALENATQKKTKALQKVQRLLASTDVEGRLKGLNELIKDLRKQIVKDPSVQKIVTETAEFSQKEFDEIVQSIAKVEARELNTLIKELEKLVQTSAGKEFLYSPIEGIMRIPRQKKVIDIQKKILDTQKELTEKIKKYQFFDFIDKEGKFYKAVRGAEKFKGKGQLTVKEINKQYQKTHGFNLFEEDAFKAFSTRGLDSIRAVNAYDFIQRAGNQFGKKSAKDFIDEVGVEWVESKIPQLKGIRVPKAIAEDLDEVQKVLTGDKALYKWIRFYDKVQAFWKGSVTGWFPDFHIKNGLGGTFNNWLAGVTDPMVYKETADVLRNKKGFITVKGKKMSYEELKKMMKEYGVIDQQGYLDIADYIARDAAPTGSKIPHIIMNVIENELRGALFIDSLKKGLSAEQASKKVIKYHFDYMPEGFTKFERNVMRRVIPFYTWTRNNIPLQIEQMIMQPAKYAGVFKAQSAFGIRPGSVEEALMPRWMKDRFTIKGEGGYWTGLGLPFEDVAVLLSGDLRGLGVQISPFIKAPIEQLTGYNIFKEKQISEDNYGKLYKNAPQFLQDYLKIKKRVSKAGTTYYTVDPQRKYWLELIFSRGLNTALKAANAVDERASLLPLITSINKYEYNIRDLRRWRDKEKGAELEEALRRASEIDVGQYRYIPKNR